MMTLDTCEVCGKASDGFYAIFDLFNVEVCTKHARALREAFFCDATIAPWAITWTMATTALAQGMRNDPTAAANTFESLSNARQQLYNSVMGWIGRERTSVAERFKAKYGTKEEASK